MMRARGKQSASPRLWSCLAALAAIAALAAAPTAAIATEGAHFTYELCDSALPGGNTPGAHYVVEPGAPLAGANTCAQPGGSLAITETGHAGATYAYWNLPVPATPGGYVEAVTISGAACGLGPGNDHTYVFEQPFPGNLCSESAHYFHVASAPSKAPGRTAWILMNCDGNYAPGCEAGPSIHAHYIAATEVDVQPPAIAGLEGTLLGGEVLRGHQTLAAKATDVGGGLAKIAVAVNGLPAGEPQAGACGLAQVKNPSYTGTVALGLTPCPTSLTAQWTLDTAAYPFHNGPNTLAVCASDFATAGEPNTVCSPPQTVDVNNSCADSPVAGGQVLDARFAKSHDDAVTVPFGHTAIVTGELADNAGDPISGATICVQAQTRGTGNGPHPVATATTDAQGDFAYKLAPGPNRRLLVGYRHDSFQVARTISYFAHARPQLHVRPGRIAEGGRVQITGKLPRPRAAGRVVVLQAGALHGGRWLTFRKATTGKRGYFKSSYRFGSTRHTITYRIRAVVPRQRGYPYDPGHSKPRRVKVRRGARG